MVVVPCPLNVIGVELGIVTVEVQVQVPPGTKTVSPLCAVLMAACTSVCAQELAKIELACASAQKTRPRKMVDRSHLVTMNIRGIPQMGGAFRPWMPLDHIAYRISRI